MSSTNLYTPPPPALRVQRYPGATAPHSPHETPRPTVIVPRTRTPRIVAPPISSPNPLAPLSPPWVRPRPPPQPYRPAPPVVAPVVAYVVAKPPPPDETCSDALCALIGLLFAWVPLVGFVTLCINADAPPRSLRRVLSLAAGAVACVVLLLYITVGWGVYRGWWP